jgi:DNA-binding NarL/FixJ family response regulator
MLEQTASAVSDAASTASEAVPRAELTSRELEVLEMASLGRTNAQIAAQLNVTIHAIKFHLAAVYRKLGVTNRTEAAVLHLKAAALPDPFADDRGSGA